MENEKENLINVEKENDIEENLINLYMLVDSLYEDGVYDMDTIYDYYDIIDEYGLRGFVGSVEECVEALNAALNLYRITNGIENIDGPKVHVCKDCGGYYTTAN